MIGYLRGTILYKNEPDLLIEAGGVGFEVTATSQAFRTLPGEGETGELHIHTLVREEELALFGFASREERAMFELLMQVSGVGPRIAMIVVSELGEEAFVQAVLASNPLPFTRIKGIGSKTADRIILELRDRVSKLYSGGRKAAARAAPSTGNLALVEEALLGLGFKRPEIAGPLHELRSRKDEPVDVLLRDALRRVKK